MSEWWTEEQEERAAEALYGEPSEDQMSWNFHWRRGTAVREQYLRTVRKVLAAAGPPSVSPEPLRVDASDLRYIIDLLDGGETYDAIAQLELLVAERVAAVSPPGEPAAEHRVQCPECGTWQAPDTDACPRCDTDSSVFIDVTFTPRRPVSQEPPKEET